MKYLFLDLEWQEKENGDGDIMEIGAKYIDNVDLHRKNFFNYVKPENIDEVTNEVFLLLKISKKLIMQEEDIKSVLFKFINKFSEFDFIVVWNINTYNLFMKKVNKYNFTLPKHKVIVLQNILSVICRNNIGFEKALKNYKIDYDKKYLHNAGDDADYLCKLFFNVKVNYAIKNKTPLYSVNGSNVIHSKNCRHIKGKNNVVQVSMEEIFKGRALCKHCAKANTFTKMKNISEYDKAETGEFSEAYISKLCNLFGLEFSIGEKIIFIKTKLAHWRIRHNYKEIINIYHENLRKNKRSNLERNKFEKDFHIQKIKVKDMYDALKYISKHDKKINMGSKSHIDMLFEQIAAERNNSIVL